MNERRPTLPPSPQGERTPSRNYPPAEALRFSIFGDHAETMQQMYEMLMEWQLTPLFVDTFATHSERIAYRDSLLLEEDRAAYDAQRHHNKLSVNTMGSILNILFSIDRFLPSFPNNVQRDLYRALHPFPGKSEVSFVSSITSQLQVLLNKERCLDYDKDLDHAMVHAESLELREKRVALVQKLDVVVDELVACILRYTYPTVVKDT